MPHQTGKRSQIAKAIGFAAAAMLVVAVPSHAQSAGSSDSTANAPSTAQRDNSAAGAMSPGNQHDTSRQNSANSVNNADTFGPNSSGSSGNMSSSDSSGASMNNMNFTTGSVNAKDRNLIRELAAANMAEINTAKIAQSKTSNDQVRSFAQQMIDDHTQVGAQLQQLAQAKNVSLPTSPNAKQRAEAKKLQALSGEKFDNQYLSIAGVSDHKKAEQLVKRISAQAKDSELKTFASNLEPSFAKHLDLAQQTAGMKAGQTSSGSSTSNNPSSGMSNSNSTNNATGSLSDTPAMKSTTGTTKNTSGTAGGSN